MLKLQHVSKYYRGEETVVQALRRVNLTMSSGEFVVITGESGSGKSTLLNVISGLDTYEEGELSVNGEETSYYGKEDWEHYRSQYIGFIFQNYNIIDSYTVLQNVMAALTIQGYPKADRKARAIELIDRVGLKAQLKQKSSTLSGGQKQRVAIARALAKDAPIIVADEPTGNLDKKAGQNIIKLLKAISRDKLVVMVTHNYEEVKDEATRRIRLFDGEVVEDKTLIETDPITAEPKPIHEGMRWSEKLAMAVRNLLAMPKRLLLTLMIGLFIVAVFSFTYGSYVEASSAQNIGAWNPFFQNNNPSRLIVLRRDQAPFSQEELAAFNNLSRVQEVIPFDPVFELRMGLEDSWRDYQVMSTATLTRRDLQSGQLPESADEIVVPRDMDVEVGETIRLVFDSDRFYRQPMESNNPSGMAQTFTVAGVHTARFHNNIYLHHTALERPIMQYKAIEQHVSIVLQIEDKSAEIEYLQIRFDDQLEADTVHIGQHMFELIISPPYLNIPDMTETAFLEEPFEIAMRHPLDQQSAFTSVQVESIVPQNQFDMPTMIMSSALFETLFQLESTQVTLVVTDGFDAGRVREALDTAVYHTIYPAEYQPMELYLFTIFERLASFIAVFFQLTVMYFLTYLALRNIMRARKRDYVIYRSIGATQKDLNQITILELVGVFLTAFIIMYLLWIVNAIVVTPIPNYLRYYTPGNYLFAAGLLAGLAILLGLRFNRKIFKDSVITALRTE